MFLGATIVFRYDPVNFEMEKFQKTIPEAEGVDSYVSKVWFGSDQLVQVVFADIGSYKGKSVDLAKNFFQTKFAQQSNSRSLFPYRNFSLKVSGTLMASWCRL